MHAFKVGELYNPAKTSWPEAIQYNYRGSGHELVLFYAHPTPEEIREVGKSPVSFAVAVNKATLYFCFRFADKAWSDTAFSIHLVPEAERFLPLMPSTPQGRTFITIFLVDGATGILKVMRAVSFSPEFTQALHGLIREQATQPYPGNDAYERDGIRYYSLNSSNQISTKLAVATCQGGT